TLENLDVELEFLAQGLRGLGEIGGGADVAAEIPEILGERHALRHRLAPAHRALDLGVGLVLVLDQEADPARPPHPPAPPGPSPRRGLASPPGAIEPIGAIGEQPARQLDAPRQRATRWLEIGDRHGRLPGRATGEGPGCAADRIAERLVAGVVALAKTD